MISWFGRTADHYSTRGAEVRCGPEGWFAIVGRFIRGPLRDPDSAMDAAAEMLARERRAAAERREAA